MTAQKSQKVVPSSGIELWSAEQIKPLSQLAKRLAATNILIRTAHFLYPEEMLSIENEPVWDPHDFTRKVALVDDAGNNKAQVHGSSLSGR